MFFFKIFCRKEDLNESVLGESNYYLDNIDGISFANISTFSSFDVIGDVKNFLFKFIHFII